MKICDLIQVMAYVYALCMHDKAFDRGFLTIDTNYAVVISRILGHYLPQEGLENSLVAYDGQKILLPDRFLPDKDFLEIHQKEYFIM